MTGTLTCGSVGGSVTAGGIGAALVGDAVVDYAMLGSMGTISGSFADETQIDE